MKQTGYDKTTKTAAFQGKTITVTHLTPILSPEARERRRREIERDLYDVFVKYTKNERSAG